MSWFLFAISGYFLYAVVTIVNKFLLRQRATTKPVVFSFWIGLLSVFVFILAPFGLSWPGIGPFLLDLLAGLIFFVALLYFYESLDINEASKAASLIGALIPILVLALSYLFLREGLAPLQLLAFAFLVSGGFLISVKFRNGHIKEDLKGVKFIVLAIVLSAIYWVLAKYIFEQQGFINGFIWSRLGLTLGSLLILLRPAWRKMIITSQGQATIKLSSILVSSKFLAGFGSLFVHLALSRASAPLVNAIQGTEYVFLLGFTILLSEKFPDVLSEKLSAKIIIQKIIAVLLIGGGLGILAI